MVATSAQYRHILSRHLPPVAVDGVYAYLDRHRVHLHITHHRRTKLGDYRRPYPGHEFHEISVNGDLNPYSFLWVLLHEMAHLDTRLLHPQARPHGHEWQGRYALLLQAYSHCFPPEVQPLLASYVKRIPLQVRLRRAIEEALHRHDAGRDPDQPLLTLDCLPAGTPFRLAQRPSLLMVPLERRRSRWLCRCLDNGRQYLVQGAAEVLPANTDALS